jgi:hypothetical protein
LLEEHLGQDRNITTTFQRYTNEKLTPHFSADFSTVSFSFERGNNEQPEPTSRSRKARKATLSGVFLHAAGSEQLISQLNIADAEES